MIGTCRVELVDARSARGCTACGGLWVEAAVLTEMIHEMLPPGPLGRLELAVLDRSSTPPIGCPSCGEAMTATTIHEVILDACTKHGVWFDADELRIALQRVAEPGRASPLRELAAAVPLPARRVAGGPRPAPPSAGAYQPEVAFVIRPPTRASYELRVRRPVIKLGKLSSAHLRIDDDDDVSRLHAVIEVEAPGHALVIDLGSTAGTLVNGAPVTKRQIKPGDQLRLGRTLIDVVSIT